jgi:hypothetical protein
VNIIGTKWALKNK